jgi:EAL domain-containing protein (putative c-di-GMP-specific phosphodiesterase class I)
MPDSTTTSAGPPGSPPAPLPGAPAHGPIVAGRGPGARSIGSGGTPSRTDPAFADGRWLPRLRHAIDEDMFVLHFQPVVSLAEHRVAHHEALLRLADQPDGGLVAPAAFLPAAERHGLIGEIDRMVIDKAAALLGGARGTRLAVNVSALSATDETMLAYIERRLARHRVDPAALVVEVTETAAITDMARAREFCAGIESLGCAIALDDFGAGFGSFQYLKHLPFSQLKIDGDFIRALPASRTDQLVVKALVSVVRGMGRRTVAEFVGDEHTVTMLRNYGVDYAQGFHVGRPRAAFG